MCNIINLYTNEDGVVDGDAVEEDWWTERHRLCHLPILPFFLLRLFLFWPCWGRSIILTLSKSLIIQVKSINCYLIYKNYKLHRTLLFSISNFSKINFSICIKNENSSPSLYFEIGWDARKTILECMTMASWWHSVSETLPETTIKVSK